MGLAAFGLAQTGERVRDRVDQRGMDVFARRRLVRRGNALRLGWCHYVPDQLPRPVPLAGQNGNMAYAASDPLLHRRAAPSLSNALTAGAILGIQTACVPVKLGGSPAR